MNKQNSIAVIITQRSKDLALKKKKAEKTPTSQIPGWLANTSYYIHFLGVFFFVVDGGGVVFNFFCIPFLSKDCYASLLQVKLACL